MTWDVEGGVKDSIGVDVCPRLRIAWHMQELPTGDIQRQRRGHHDAGKDRCGYAQPHVNEKSLARTLSVCNKNSLEGVLTSFF